MTPRRTPPPPRRADKETEVILQDVAISLFILVSTAIFFKFEYFVDSRLDLKLKLYALFKIYFYLAVFIAIVVFFIFAHAHGVRWQLFDQICLWNTLGMFALYTADMSYPALIEGALFVLFMTFGYRRALVEGINQGYDVQYLILDFDAMVDTRKKFALVVFALLRDKVWPVVSRVVAAYWFHALLVWFVVQLAWHYQTELVQIVSEMFEVLKRAVAWLGPYAQILVDALEKMRLILVDLLERARRVLVELLRRLVDLVFEFFERARLILVEFLGHLVDLLFDLFQRLVDFVNFMFDFFDRFFDFMFEVFQHFKDFMFRIWEWTAGMREFFGRMWIQFKHFLQYAWDAIEALAQKLWLLLCELAHPSIQTMGAVLFLLIAEFLRRSFKV